MRSTTHTVISILAVLPAMLVLILSIDGSAVFGKNHKRRKSSRVERCPTEMDYSIKMLASYDKDMILLVASVFRNKENKQVFLDKSHLQRRNEHLAHIVGVSNDATVYMHGHPEDNSGFKIIGNNTVPFTFRLLFSMNLTVANMFTFGVYTTVKPESVKCEAVPIFATFKTVIDTKGNGKSEIPNVFAMPNPDIQYNTCVLLKPTLKSENADTMPTLMRNPVNVDALRVDKAFDLTDVPLGTFHVFAPSFSYPVVAVDAEFPVVLHVSRLQADSGHSGPGGQRRFVAERNLGALLGAGAHVSAYNTQTGELVHAHGVFMSENDPDFPAILRTVADVTLQHAGRVGVEALRERLRAFAKINCTTMALTDLAPTSSNMEEICITEVMKASRLAVRKALASTTMSCSKTMHNRTPSASTLAAKNKQSGRMDGHNLSGPKEPEPNVGSSVFDDDIFGEALVSVTMTTTVAGDEEISSYEYSVSSLAPFGTNSTQDAATLLSSLTNSSPQAATHDTQVVGPAQAPKKEDTVGGPWLFGNLQLPSPGMWRVIVELASDDKNAGTELLPSYWLEAR